MLPLEEADDEAGMEDGRRQKNKVHCLGWARLRIVGGGSKAKYAG